MSAGREREREKEIDWNVSAVTHMGTWNKICERIELQYSTMYLDSNNIHVKANFFLF